MRASSAGSGLSIEVSFEEIGFSPRSQRDPRSSSRPSSSRKTTRWPLVLCGLFATVAATAAFAESPLGQDESVRPTIVAARSAATVAWHSVVRRVHM